MSDYDGSIKIDTSIDTSGFHKGSAELLKAIQSLTAQIDTLGKQIQSSFGSMGAVVSTPTKDVEAMKKEIEELRKRLDEMGKSGSNEGMTEGLTDAEAMAKELDDMLSSLVERYEELRQLGVAALGGDAGARELFNQGMAQAEADFNNLLDRTNAYGDMSLSDGTRIADTEQFSAFSQAIVEVQGAYQGLLNMVSSTSKIASGIGIAVDVAVTLAGALGKVAMTAAKAGIWLAKMTGPLVVTGMRKVASGALSAAKGMLGLNRSASANPFKGMVKNMILTGIGIKSLSSLFTKLRSSIVGGLDGVAQYDSGLKSALTSLKSSLATLQSALSAAFAPIVTFVAPYITKFIDLITNAVGKVGQFIAALTGSTTYAKAAGKATGGYASGLNKTAAAAKKARRQLAGFDKLEILKKDSGGGGGASGPGFSTQKVSGPIADFVKGLKDAFQAGEFEKIGKMIATRINILMAKIRKAIDWGTVGPRITKFVKAFTGVFNGLVKGVNWRLLGATIATGINTIIYTLSMLTDSLNWAAIGKALADGLNGLFDKIDWAAIGKYLSGGFKAILTFLDTAISNFDAEGLGKNLYKLLKKIDWAGIVKRFFGVLGKAFGKIGAFFRGLFKDAFKKLTAYFKQYAFDKDGKFIFSGFCKGILNAFKAIGAWIKENIFDPFIKGFKDAFGISSPAKEMIGPGEFVGKGILEGIAAPFLKIGDWINDHILEPIKSFFSGKSFSDLWSGFSSSQTITLTGIVDKVQEVAGGIKSKVISGFEASLSSFGASAIATKDRVIGSFKASFSTFGASAIAAKDRVIGSFKASFSTFGASAIAAKDRVIDSFKAKVGSFSNGIANKDRVLTGFKAKITSFLDSAGKTLKNLLIGGSKKAKGGVFNGHSWHDIPQYAGGTTNAGSVFVAGEAGPEVVGHVNGRTEVLNKSQLAAAIYAAVVNGMGQAVNALGSYLYSGMATCTNSVIAGIQGLTVQSASIERSLAALASIQYAAPAMSTGSIVPYAIDRAATKITDCIEANNDELIKAMVAAFSSATLSIVSAIQASQSPTINVDMNAVSKQVIGEINRRTLMFGASPLKV